MNFQTVILTDEVIEKLASKHSVTDREVVEVLTNEGAPPVVLFAESGHREGEDVYKAMGQTHGGRYLAVFFIRKLNNDARVISARDMANKERKRYAQAKAS